MDFAKLIQDQFAQSVLIAVITTAAPLIFTFLMEHFGWRASLSRDAKLYEELRTTAGDNANDDELEVIRVVRAKVFDRARSHIIDQSKGLRVLVRAIEINLFAMYALFVLTFVLGVMGHKALSVSLSACLFAILMVLIALAVIFIPWSIYDQARRSKASKVLDDSRSSELLFTSDSKPNIKKQRDAKRLSACEM